MPVDVHSRMRDKGSSSNPNLEPNAEVMVINVEVLVGAWSTDPRFGSKVNKSPVVDTSMEVPL